MTNKSDLLSKQQKLMWSNSGWVILSFLYPAQNCTKPSFICNNFDRLKYTWPSKFNSSV